MPVPIHSETLYFYTVRKKKNPIVEKVEVEDYAAEGKSLARVDGKVIFIENVVPGDIVDVQLTRSKKDWGEGYPTHFHFYSTNRVVPFCQHFGVCGGCQWQMLPYGQQLQYKQKQVWDNLTRIGKIHLPEMRPIVGAQETRFYRNKLEYTFSTKEFTAARPISNTASGPHPNLSPLGEGTMASPQPPPIERALLTHKGSLERDTNNSAATPAVGALKFGAPPLMGEVGRGPQGLGAGKAPSVGGGWGEAGAAGFHAKGFFDKVVQIEKCWLQPEPTNALRNAIRQYAYENDLNFYDIRNHTGFLRTMQVRVCTTGEVMVNIVLGEEREEERKKLLDFVVKSFPQITTLLYTINLKFNDSMHDLKPIPYSGKGYVIERLEDFKFKIGPKSFFQTNTKQAEQLYKITRDFAELNGSQVVYDLYCGTGSIGIFCSKGAKKIVGVEVIEAAINDAKENAALNDIHHSFFTQGDVAAVCNTDFFNQHGRPDVIITDPPRAGMHEKLVQKILETEAPTVVYVSCNPATQARDLALLDEKYAVTQVQPVDMFPHTHHIENVVQLKLK